MPLAIRRARMRWPTSISWDVVLLALDFEFIARSVPLLPDRKADDIKCRLFGYSLLP
jgi:hypothetical protein